MRLLTIMFVCLFVFSMIVHAEDVCRTDGHPNGRWVLEHQKEHYSSGRVGKVERIIDNLRLLAFIEGALEARAQYDSNPLYDDATLGDVKDMLVRYYRNNPMQRHRPAVDVILRKCAD